MSKPMKTTRHALPGRLLALSLLVSAGCSKERPAATVADQPRPAPAPASPAATTLTPAPATVADPCAEMKTALDGATLENQADLAAIHQRMDQEIDAQVAAKKAGADVSLTASGKLDAATDNFAEKLRMLSVARPETWNSAKHEAVLALQNVRSAFAEVMSSPQRR